VLKMFDGGHFFIRNHAQDVVDAVGDAFGVRPLARH